MCLLAFGNDARVVPHSLHGVLGRGVGLWAQKRVFVRRLVVRRFSPKAPICESVEGEQRELRGPPGLLRWEGDVRG